MLENIPPCTGQLQQWSIIQFRISTVPRWRNPDLWQEEGEVKYVVAEGGSWFYVGVRWMNSVSQSSRNQWHQLKKAKTGEVEFNYVHDCLVSRNFKETREVFEKIETLCKQRAQTLTTEFNLAKEGGGDIKGVRNNENVVWPMNWRFNRLYRVWGNRKLVWRQWSSRGNVSN